MTLVSRLQHLLEARDTSVSVVFQVERRPVALLFFVLCPVRKRPVSPVLGSSSGADGPLQTPSSSCPSAAGAGRRVSSGTASSSGLGDLRLLGAVLGAVHSSHGRAVT